MLPCEKMAVLGKILFLVETSLSVSMTRSPGRFCRPKANFVVKLKKTKHKNNPQNPTQTPNNKRWTSEQSLISPLSWPQTMDSAVGTAPWATGTSLTPCSLPLIPLVNKCGSLILLPWQNRSVLQPTSNQLQQTVELYVFLDCANTQIYWNWRSIQKKKSAWVNH